MKDTILERLRENRSFKVNHCPTARPHRKEKRSWQRNQVPEKNCQCDDVVYTGEGAVKASFMCATIVIANVNTKCYKWEIDYCSLLYDPEVVRSNKYSYRQVVKGISAKELREKLRVASSREAEMLAWASPELKDTYNQGHVNIRGVPFSISRLRKALMYQEDQVFDITLVTWHDEEPLYNKDGCPMLFIVGGKHHITVLGQHPEDTAKFVGMTSIGYDAYTD